MICFARRAVSTVFASILFVGAASAYADDSNTDLASQFKPQAALTDSDVMVELQIRLQEQALIEQAAEDLESPELLSADEALRESPLAAR